MVAQRLSLLESAKFLFRRLRKRYLDAIFTKFNVTSVIWYSLILGLRIGDQQNTPSGRPASDIVAGHVRR